jgi:hypothetical protein
MVETAEMQPEGEELHRKTLVVKRGRDGEPPGREPTHAEFVEGLLNDVEVARLRARGVAPHPTKTA